MVSSEGFSCPVAVSINGVILLLNAGKLRFVK